MVARRQVARTANGRLGGAARPGAGELATPTGVVRRALFGITGITGITGIMMLAIALLASCGPKTAEVRPTESADTVHTEPTPATPEERVLADMAGWVDALPQWTRVAEAPFESEGHELARAVTSIKGPDAAAFASRSFGAGHVIALASHTSPEDDAAARGPRIAWMVKMAPGYDPDGHDWFFADMDGDNAVTISGPASDPAVAEACGNCHRYGAGGTDFVFGVPTP